MPISELLKSLRYRMLHTGLPVGITDGRAEKLAFFWDNEEEDEEKKKKPVGGLGLLSSRIPASRGAGMLPWALGGVGATALGGAYGLASDSGIAAAKEGFRMMGDPTAVHSEDTTLMHYARYMGPGTRLRIFGQPVSKVIPAMRRFGWATGAKPLAPGDAEAKKKGGIWQGLAGWAGENSAIGKFLQHGLGFPGYDTNNPSDYQGAKAHYEAFARGPVAAYYHMYGWEGDKAFTPEELKAIPDIGKKNYGQYFGPKFVQYILNRNRAESLKETALLPIEYDTEFKSPEEQSQILRDWVKSLPPAEQDALRRIENAMTNLRTGNLTNYKPIVEGGETVRKWLKGIGYTAGGAGVGGLLGSGLYRAFTDDDEESSLGHNLSTAAGIGVGGAAGYFGGTEHGRGLIKSLIQKLVGGTKQAELRSGAGTAGLDSGATNIPSGHRRFNIERQKSRKDDIPATPRLHQPSPSGGLLGRRYAHLIRGYAADLLKPWAGESDAKDKLATPTAIPSGPPRYTSPYTPEGYFKLKGYSVARDTAKNDEPIHSRLPWYIWGTPPPSGKLGEYWRDTAQLAHSKGLDNHTQGSPRDPQKNLPWYKEIAGSNSARPVTTPVTTPVKTPWYKNPTILGIGGAGAIGSTLLLAHLLSNRKEEEEDAEDKIPATKTASVLRSVRYMSPAEKQAAYVTSVNSEPDEVDLFSDLLQVVLPGVDMSFDSGLCLC